MELREFFRNRDMVGKQENELTEAKKNIAVLTIDGNVISGYGSYTFVRVKEYVTEPQRSQNGQIANLDGYTTFITPKVRIKFNALSIDGYRTLMNLILSKNEFDVGCYDFVADRWVHQNMYFYPNDYPEIFQYDLDVLAVLNYEIELIGTNTNNENIVITLNRNYPETESSAQKQYTVANAFKDEEVLIQFPEGATNFGDKEIEIDSVAYTFVHWNTKADGSGVSYTDDETYTFGGDTTLYAIWDSGTVTVTFNYTLNSVAQTMQLDFLKSTKFNDKNTIQADYIVVEDGVGNVKYEFGGWFKNTSYQETDSIVGLRPQDLTNYNAYGKYTRTGVVNPTTGEYIRRFD